ncbi:MULTISPECIES: hypothetical protein [Thermoanaerobacterium]|uniref:Uncharacterized protein n=3 Tax=Thermoanaerobacterium TaxID=28895 RepID=L0ILI2_THETR|nr:MULTISPECIES: hypothetical protein [Thermoanaerobacterium]AFK94323.1 hypothetical protein Tsac_2776 [Thermoanaerobacterium saccharolyticum JW/SL-YS485]AGB20360.1 hypothetical protein Thethe_02807 [Thermoanaerobacterium thermosaccharolyticum M0795]ETO39093.1 hypothetical protein V518_0681 [Thermoanaerobacterium aotearoense SCUT27]
MFPDNFFKKNVEEPNFILLLVMAFMGIFWLIKKTLTFAYRLIRKFI